MATQSEPNYKKRMDEAMSGDTSAPDYHLKQIKAATKDKPKNVSKKIKGKKGTQSGPAEKDKKKGGGYVKSKGGSVRKAAKNKTDGIAKKGKTKGRFV